MCLLLNNNLVKCNYPLSLKKVRVLNFCSNYGNYGKEKKNLLN